MAGSQRKQFLHQVQRVLGSQRVGVLAARYRDASHQTLVAYVASEDLREIYFVSPKYTRKVAAIAADPRVSLLIDDRQNLESDFDACMAVTARGEAEELAGEPRPAFLARYLERHPYLEEFAASPSCGYYRIRVQSYTLVSRFQHVEEMLL